jgi:hypothetical protein
MREPPHSLLRGRGECTAAPFAFGFGRKPRILSMSVDQLRTQVPAHKREGVAKIHSREFTKLGSYW